MKPRATLKPILGFENVVSLNLVRLRRHIRQIAPAVSVPNVRPQSGYLRRLAIKAKTGGHFKG